MNPTRLFFLAVALAALFGTCGNARSVDVVETPSAGTNPGASVFDVAEAKAPGHANATGRRHKKPKAQATKPGGLPGVFSSVRDAVCGFCVNVKNFAGSIWPGKPAKKPATKAKPARGAAKHGKPTGKPTAHRGGSSSS